jgi:gamma-glutamyl hydrolase
MVNRVVSYFLISLALLATCFYVQAQTVVNSAPVIAIISHPETEASVYYPNRQYIAASYVKWIESAGGRVVPLLYTTPIPEMKKILRQVNGLLLTGGAFVYPDVMTSVFDEVVAMNQEGIYFPVWGTCLGFQWVGIYFSQNRNLLISTPAADVPMHLDFAPTANQTSWFNSMSDSMKAIFADKDLKVTMNNHNWGIGLDDFNKQLSEQFNLISTNLDAKNGTFVSAMQHVKYPIIGTQFHPEKNNFEFGVDDKGVFHSTTMHSLESVLSSQYSANFFVHQCRKNTNQFNNWKELQARLTYSYPKFRGNTGSFVEKYWFEAGSGVF